MASMKDCLGEIILDFETAAGRIVKIRKTLGFPGTVSVQDKSEPDVDIADHRKVMGKTMCFRKNSSETSNQTRELARFLDHPAEEHRQAMECF